MARMHKLADNPTVVFIRQHAAALILFILTIGVLIWTWMAFLGLVDRLHQLI